MFSKLLLATDGSEHSIRSAGYAVELAQQFHAKIDVVYVIDEKKSKSDVLHHVDKYDLKIERQEKIKPVLALLDKEKIDYEVHFTHGEPAPSIIEFAESNQSDCVIVGSRGRNKVQTMILGSVSHKVAKHVHCPVLIIK
ncbi:universal stress protein [Paraliobacillus sp. X-1268]|uniref:universal stress protein n=1 Tax=Paraliobacillus sp. X-1268 TaxID=2213193 RepID=UPI000E3BEAB6|nr:universal stress protein [Paraliobacillus sp. X-1268]